MKKTYETPELEYIKFSITTSVLTDSRTEGGGGGVDWGNGESNFGEE